MFCFDNSYPFHTDERVFITLVTERVVNDVTDDITLSLAAITDSDVGCPGRLHLTYHRLSVDVNCWLCRLKEHHLFENQIHFLSINLILNTF